MALIDTECSSCGRIEAVYRPASMWPDTPPCAHCGATTEQRHFPAHVNTSTVDPVVVYEAPDGTFRFPPATDSLSSAMYEKMGMRRHEYRGAAEVRPFEKRMEKAEYSRICRAVERKQEAHEASEAARRSEVRRGLEQGFQVPEYDDRGRPTGRIETVRLTPRGREIMAEAMRRTDAKGGPKAQEVGFHVQAYSDDRSNRDPDPRRRGQ
jgi:hypothetical protein